MRHVVNDLVYTEAEVARRLIDHFGPTGRILDPPEATARSTIISPRPLLVRDKGRSRLPCMQRAIRLDYDQPRVVEETSIGRSPSTRLRSPTTSFICPAE
jgi:hypothetical protein